MTEAILDVTVVICAYTEERWQDLIAAVESIQRQSRPPREIIVVIDHNIRLFERTRMSIPGIVVIENSEPRGLSGARNSGIAMAQGAFVAFLDDDAIAEPDWLERLSNCCQDSRVLGVGGIVDPLWPGQPPVWFPMEFYWVVGCTYQTPPAATPVVVRNPFGGCAYMRREMFEMIGGFRNGIGRNGKRPLGGEETELCIRAAQHWPHKIFLCEPQAKIHHRISPYRASWHYFWLRCYSEGLSKTIIARYVGVKDSLSTERTYTFQTLPRSILRGLADTFLNHDLTGLLRAGAITTGLLLTIAGYSVGILLYLVTLLKEPDKMRQIPFQMISTIENEHRVN